MITDEEVHSKEKSLRKRALLTAGLILAGALFLVDGKSLMQQAGARLGLMSDSLVMGMIDDIEYNYYYDDIFETDTYRQIKTELTGKPLKTYKDFEEYIFSLSELAGDEFTYFYYDSLPELRTDYSDVDANDYQDDFTVFRKEGIPVIRFRQFAYETGDRVVNALKETHQSGDRVVMLDLSDNPGGMIDQCVLICDALLPEGVIFEEQYNDLSRYQYVSDPQMMRFDKIIILLNSEALPARKSLPLH